MKYASLLLGLFLTSAATVSFADCRDDCNTTWKGCISTSTAATQADKETACMPAYNSCIDGCLNPQPSAPSEVPAAPPAPPAQ